METNYIIIIFIRMILFVTSLALLVTFIKQFPKCRIISIALLVVALLNIYFMFFHNQIQISPLYNDSLPNSFYEEFNNSYNQNSDSTDFYSEDNFYGSYSIQNGKIDKINYENNSDDFEYHIDKYVYLNRDFGLLLTPVDYHGKIYIYSKDDDKTLIINYKMYLSDENSEALFSLNQYTCSGIEKNYTFDGIIFDA